VTGAAVAAAADSQLRPGLTRERDDVRHIGCVGDPNNGRRAVVEPADMERASRIVVGIARRNHPPVNGGAQPWDRDRVCCKGWTVCTVT